MHNIALTNSIKINHMSYKFISCFRKCGSINNDIGGNWNIVKGILVLNVDQILVGQFIFGF